VEIHRPGYELAPRGRADEDHVALESLAQDVEETPGQILTAPIELLDRREIDLKHLGEHLVRDFLAGEDSNRDALLFECAALVTDRGAAFVLQAVQIIVE